MAILCAPGSLKLKSGLHALQMEVGIEDCLHIEFEYDKGRYHLKDTVVGKIYFLLVSLSLPNLAALASYTGPCMIMVSLSKARQHLYCSWQ